MTACGRSLSQRLNGKLGSVPQRMANHSPTVGGSAPIRFTPAIVMLPNRLLLQRPIWRRLTDLGVRKDETAGLVSRGECPGSMGGSLGVRNQHH